MNSEIVELVVVNNEHDGKHASTAAIDAVDATHTAAGCHTAGTCTQDLLFWDFLVAQVIII